LKSTKRNGSPKAPNCSGQLDGAPMFPRRLTDDAAKIAVEKPEAAIGEPCAGLAMLCSMLAGRRCDVEAASSPVASNTIMEAVEAKVDGLHGENLHCKGLMLNV